MTFDSDERGVETSRPRELIVITHGTTSYQIATGERDILIGGQLYVATPSARSDFEIENASSNQGSAQRDVTIQLAVTHPYVKRYLAFGSPPQLTAITIIRAQLISGETEQVYTGYVTSLAIEHHIARFLLSSKAQRMFGRRLPVLLVDQACGHILYDANCRISRPAFTFSTTVTFVDGRDIKVASMSGHPDDWAKGGAVKHTSSGEQMTIWKQVGVDIEMQAPVAEIQTGDAIEISAGCEHDIITCGTKFSNAVNFGALPQRPTSNPYIPTGFGSVEQS